MASSSLLSLGGLLAVSFSGAAAGSAACVNAKEFYATLKRPNWAPSASWLFAPVLVAAAAVTGIAAWMVWNDADFRPVSMVLFAYQVALTIAWSWFFFVQRRGNISWGLVVTLLVTSIITAKSFYDIEPTAAALLTPHLLCAVFATSLTNSVWLKNIDLYGYN